MARVLIADDEASIRAFVSRALESAGHEVGVAANGGAALEALGAAPYDLLLSDIAMPELDGVTLALMAAKAYPRLRIVLMTGYAHEHEHAHNLDCLAHEIVEKPFSLAIIRGVVETALATPERPSA